MTRQRLHFTLHVIVPIISGGLIYICWRQPVLLMFGWLRVAGLEPFTNNLRDFAAPGWNFLPAWFVYSLPDGLWVYALTACMVLIWSGTESLRSKAFWLALGFILGVGSELGQLTGVVPGNFDYVDLVVCAVAPIAAFVFTANKVSLKGA